MEIVLIGLAVLIAAGAVAALVTTYRARGLRAGGGAVGARAQSAVGPATRPATATSPRDGSAGERDAAAIEEPEGDGSAGPSTADLREQLDLELVQRRAELGRIEGGCSARSSRLTCGSPSSSA